jgi:hypothetical protein
MEVKMPRKGQRTGTVSKCRQCGAEVYSYPSRPRQFCSKSCARTFANLTEANPSFHRDVSGSNNPMYGRGMSGEANPMYGKRGALAPRWTGGRKVRKDGYVLVAAPADHPYPSYTKPSGAKYILEHRAVMEAALGRYLRPEEVVHHIDGNPSNNRLDNLRLFASQSDHIREAHH